MCRAAGRWSPKLKDGFEDTALFYILHCNCVIDQDKRWRRHKQRQRVAPEKENAPVGFDKNIQT